MGALSEKVAVVTGATSGMGEAIACLFAREGASVIVGGRDPARATAVIEKIQKSGGEARTVLGDVSRPETSQQLIETAQNSFGGVDILVANAGQLGLGSLTEIDVDTWHSTIATNLHSVYYLLRYGLPRLQKRGGGSVVVNGSIAAFKGFPKHAAYCASKGALVSLVKQVARDYGPAIRVNLICPGPVDTPMIWESAEVFPEPDTAVAEAADATVLGRLGSPEDVARAALFFASDASSWITGASLVVDGGITTI